ncbi:C40 family peptidase [Terrisporobacter mayombei]|uniref:Murein DD-endopeptidase MepH n=1 Tax=Terrisporobacter mayombei TaxID=1541 RepID=A0ABY9Q5U7_9FIRM|nr:C40 family peptidase [Terrisporobacter mayombei]MCC3870069.1 C40 family peptidase [Terrisporobacter mayombei]WMT82435.1 Murein DD-endopeptidase MepH [Terrisporobacter mayombei]
MKNFKRKLIALLLLVTMITPVLATPTQIDAASKSSKSTKVVSFAKKQLGKKYVWGNSGPSTFDCSGFTYYVIKKTTGKSISRTSTTQSKQGKYVSRKNLKKGDLVFFATTGNGRVSHAGIYIGNKKFIHASSTKGKVVISSMASGHYYNTFVNGRRVI